MQFLKQSTAAQSVLVGPFVDSTDGVTAETALTIANTDIRLSANGGNMFAKTSGGGTHDEAGWYTVTLDATDTATVGRLQLSVAVAGALPVFMEFQVVEEAIYDALFASGATGLLPANVTQISDDATAAANLEAAFDGTGYDIGGLDVSELNQIVDDLINGGRLDLLVDAIKAKTDQLVFTVANQVDANVQSINDATVTGDGNATPWDGA